MTFSQQQSQQSSTPNPDLMGAYSSLLGMNQSNYANILSAYAQGQGNLSNALGGIYGGYGQVNDQVQNTLGMGQVLGKNGNWGVATPAAQAIGQTFARTEGQTTQQLTNAGLGNTTVGGNLHNQNALMAGQAYGGLGAQLAQTAAGYQAQFGQAGLAARMQGLGMQTGLYGQQGGALAGYHFANTMGNVMGSQGSSHGGSFDGGGGSHGSSGGTGHIPFSAGFGGGGGNPSSVYGGTGTAGGAIPSWLGGGGMGTQTLGDPGFAGWPVGELGGADMDPTGGYGGGDYGAGGAGDPFGVDPYGTGYGTDPSYSGDFYGGDF